MKGIKKYSHSDRQQVIEEMIPLIQRKFGDNLVALAAAASYARNEDSDYSDLELVAFVKTMPEDQDEGGMGRIREGLLVELEWTTRDRYLAETREVTHHWYIAGSDTLLPILNPEFIEELNRYQVNNLREKCLSTAAKRWYEVQEGTAKVLNAILAHNREGIPLVLFDMVYHMLVVISLLNQTPYITLARFITQARTFPVKPAHFEALLDLVVQGAYQDLDLLQETVVTVFTQFEVIFESLGVELYDDNVDPN